MLILFDVDGVLADCITPITKSLNSKFALSLTPEDITSFDFMKPATGILNQEQCDFAISLFEQPDFARNLLPYPDVKNKVKQLSYKHQIHYVTSQWRSSVTWCYDRFKWLEEHFNASIDDVTFTHKKALIPADILVEDKTKNLVNYAKVNPKALCLRVPRPWNADLDPARYENIADFSFQENEVDTISLMPGDFMMGWVMKNKYKESLK